MAERRQYTLEELTHHLRTVFGLERFRPGQLEVITAVLAGDDVVAILPTGAGKSLCYQLPAVLLPGMAVVVSPLIALMEDQVRALQQRRIPASCLHSGLEDAVLAQRLHESIQGRYKLLYVSPERLQQESFLHRLRACSISFVAVDEAHCISEWGHDFRPAYLHIASALRRLDRPPVVALTATATPEVQQDIVEHLQLRAPRIVIYGLDRPNLRWTVEHGRQKLERLAALCQRRRGAVLVYAASRRRVERLCGFLQQHGLPAAAYHAGIEPELRQQVQERFLTNSVPILVATSAFGLGVDKPDIRTVVHYDPPLTLEAYYQEAGRAGRDGQDAECIMLYDPGDCAVQEQLLAAGHPDWDTASRVYAAIRELAAGSSFLGLTTAELANRLRMPEATVEGVIRLLEGAGVLQTALPGGDVMLQIVATREELREYWARTAHPGRRRVVEALMRSLGAEAWWEPVVLPVAELVRRHGVGAEELESGLRALAYAGLIRCMNLSLRPGIGVLQPLPLQLPLAPQALEERRRRAWGKFERVREYAETEECKRCFLVRYFHPSASAEPCGRCSSCTQQGSSGILRQRAKVLLAPFRNRLRRTSADPHQERRRTVLELAQQGIAFESICRQTGLPAATVARLLQEALESGHPLSRAALLPDERFYTAVRIAVQRLGAVPLREIAAALGGAVDYPLLRLAVAFARRELATSGKSSAG